MGICDGRVVIVTGAGRGIGREHALELARQGARVVVNDLGATAGGEGADASPAHEVAAEVRRLGSEAIVDGSDVADFAQSAALVSAAVDAFGRLDAVVNNAGILRDRMFANTSIEEWDAIMRVHLRGHFCVSRHACAHWRERSKAGVAALTLVQAVELARYGVTANAIAPSARTRLTESVFPDMMRRPDSGFDVMDPANIAPLVTWLCSEPSRDVTGRVFEIEGGKI